MKFMNDNLRNAQRSLQGEHSPDKFHEVMQLPQFEDIMVRVPTFGTGLEGGRG